MKRQLGIILFVLFLASCSIDSEEIETRKNGLTYFKETDKLVTGTVTSKFESGELSSKVEFKSGKELGKWFCYDGSEDYILLQGESVNYPEKIKQEFPDFDLNNLTLSFDTEGAILPYDHCSINLLESTSNKNLSELIKFTNTIYSYFLDTYKIKRLSIVHGHFDYRFEKLPVDINHFKADTIDHFDDKLIKIN